MSWLPNNSEIFALSYAKLYYVLFLQGINHFYSALIPLLNLMQTNIVYKSCDVAGARGDDVERISFWSP